MFELFAKLLEKSFIEQVHLSDWQIISYVAEVLVDFTHVDNLYKIRNSQGRPLEDVGEMLLASHPLLEGSSFERERAVRKHIGDYTLFMTGLFPERLQRRSPLRLDCFVDYVKAGKESYRIVSEFNVLEYQDIAPLFRKLSEHFDYCVVGLNLVKSDLAKIQAPYYQQAKDIIDGI